MKKILLKSLSLVNFKGVSNLNVDFDNEATVIAGANGTGKTTLYDAYLWLLFGKDSSGRGDRNNGFNVKTLGADGKPIYRIEHSVTGLFEVNGQRVKLQRSLVEKWSTVNGTTEEIMKDETHYFINDVRCGTQREYQAEISEIIPEDVFRMITNPYYFTSLAPEMQRDMLFEIAGNVTDEEVAALNPEFMELLDKANGTSLAKWAKEIAAKKKACNDVLATIPTAIETAQKLTPENENWSELEAELAQKKASVAEIDAQLADCNATNEVANKRKADLIRQIGDLRMKLTYRQENIRNDATKAHTEANRTIREKENVLNAKEYELNTKRGVLQNVEKNIATANAKVESLRNDFRAAAAEKYEEPTGETLCCPTCGEPLRGDNLETKKAQMRGNFEESKANRQKTIREQGQQAAAVLRDLQDNHTRLIGEIARLDDSILEIKGEINYAKAHVPAIADYVALITNDAQCVEMTNEINQMTNELNAERQTTDLRELQEAKFVISEGIAELNQRLAKRSIIERCQKEIVELEDKQVANNQSKAELERWENVYNRFVKAKDETLSQRINGLFKLVAFSFIKEQKNGGEKTTCYCMVNGVPYADVNAAGKANAGLDIINAICRAKGIFAPIFLDNAESVNEFIPTFSQVIYLQVTHDQVLTVK